MTGRECEHLPLADRFAKVRWISVAGSACAVLMGRLESSLGFRHRQAVTLVRSRRLGQRYHFSFMETSDEWVFFHLDTSVLSCGHYRQSTYRISSHLSAESPTFFSLSLRYANTFPPIPKLPQTPVPRSLIPP